MSAHAAASPRRPDLWLLVSLVIGALAAMPLLVGPGMVNTRAGGDSPFLLLRVYEMRVALREGSFPVRWMPDAAFGLGYPAFNYYAALPYYAAAVLSFGCGIIWGIKLTQTLGFLLAAGAAYLLARRWGRLPSSALLASAVYTMAPFHLANVYVRGDSLSEFWAMALFPLTLWAQDRCCQQPNHLNVVAFAASFAALVVCHNISAMLFTPFLIVAALCSLRRPWRQTAPGLLPWWATAMALGLALSAWFWVPAIFEQHLVQLQDQTTGYFHYSGHFLDSHLVQWRFIHAYGVGPGLYPFSMGALQAAFAAMGLVVIARDGARRIRPARGYLWAAIAFALSTVLMTSASTVVWRLLPLLPYAQFPWRLLSVQALAVALLAARLVDGAPARAAVVACLVACVLACIAGLGGLQPDRLTITDGEVTPQSLMLYEVYSGNIGGTIRYEYLPRTMVPRPYTSAVLLEQGARPAPLALFGGMSSAELLASDGHRETWQITLSEPSFLAFHRTWFPGWYAVVDGQFAPVGPIDGLGLVGIRLDAGTHRVSLAFGSTPLRRAAGAVTLVSFAGAAFIPARRWRFSRATRIWLGAIGACALLWATLGLARAAIWQPVTYEGPLLMDAARAPYLHHETAPVRFGDVSLLSYELHQTRTLPGEQIEVTLRWGGEWRGHRARLVLVGATAHLFDHSPIWAEVEQEIVSPETSLAVPVPRDAPPGLYVLRVRVFKDGKDQPMRTHDGQKLAKLALEPIQIGRGEPRQTESRPLFSYGPPTATPVISLLSADAIWVAGERTEVRLVWRCERQAPLNYMLSVRLLDPDGAILSPSDVPPTLGGYPTSLWTPGEIVSDRVILPWPTDVPISEATRLEVVLYDRSTLQAMGTGSLPIRLEEPGPTD